MSEKLIVACPECETRFVAPREKFLPTGRKVRCAKCGHAWFQNIDGTVTDLSASPDTPSIPASKPVEASAAEPPSESIMDRAMTKATSSDGVIERADRRREEAEAHADPYSVAENAIDRIDDVSASKDIASAASLQSSTTTMDSNASAALEAPSHDHDTIYAPEKKKSGFLRKIFYLAALAIIAGAVGYFFKDPIAKAIPALDPPLTSWQQTVDGVVSKVIPPNRSLRIDNVKYDIEEDGDETALLLTAEVVNDSSMVKDAPKLTVTIFGADDTILETASLAPEDLATEIAAEARAPYFLRMPFPPVDLRRVEVDFSAE